MLLDRGVLRGMEGLSCEVVADYLYFEHLLLVVSRFLGFGGCSSSGQHSTYLFAPGSLILQVAFQGK